jgi:hypothetical protein
MGLAIWIHAESMLKSTSQAQKGAYNVGAHKKQVFGRTLGS